MRSLLLLGLVLVASALATAASPAVVTAEPQIAASAAPPAEAAGVEVRVAPEPRGRPIVVATAAPEAPPAPSDAPIAATEPPVVATQAPLPRACPQTFFCYPRVGIAGPILAYDDCSGVSDVGLGIRQLTCVREGIWLAGHAYTQFGRIADFRVGDAVFVRGQRFTITGSSIQHSCEPATHAVAPLSLQTSLESMTCGRVLVVEGR